MSRHRIDQVIRRAAGSVRSPARRMGALGLAMLVLASPGALGGSVSSTGIATFTEPKAGYLSTGSHVELPIYSDGFSDSIGGTIGGVGASASGSVSAAMSLAAEAFWFPTYSFAYSSAHSVNVAWDGGLSVGESFTLVAGANPLGWGKVQLQDPGFQGSVGLREQFSASANAQGCLGGCLELDLWMKLNQYQTLASIVGGTGNLDLLVLDQKVADLLPYNYTAPGNVLKVNVGAPNFSATIGNTASTAVSHTSEQLLGMLSVNVAQLIANLVGLPIPLSASVGGFGYTLLEALVGLGLDLERWFQIAATKLYTSLTFSAPVDIYDGAAWSGAKSTFTPESGKVYEIKPIQNAKTLGIVPSYGLYTDVDASLDLVPFVSASVRALEIYGHGVSFGPLLNETVKGVLAHAELQSIDVERAYWMTGKPMTLQFEPLVTQEGGGVLDLCPDLADCLATGFIPISTALEDDWNSDQIVLAKNLVGACLEGILDDPDSPCDIDPSFASPMVDYRPGPTRTDPMEFTPRYDELLAILDAPELASGPEFNAELLEAALRGLGIDPDANGLPRGAPEGDPPPTEPIAGNTLYQVRIEAVPEPGGIALLVIGAMMLVISRYSVQCRPAH